MKANLPRSFLTLPKKEKEIINKVMSEEVDRIVNAEEAEMQKIWIQLACILMHEQFGFGKNRLMMFIGAWKRIYRRNIRLGDKQKQDEWLKSEIDKIFGKDGYPYKWIDDLEDLS